VCSWLPLAAPGCLWLLLISTVDPKKTTCLRSYAGIISISSINRISISIISIISFSIIRINRISSSSGISGIVSVVSVVLVVFVGRGALVEFIGLVALVV
jgi:hypothetical protein